MNTLFDNGTHKIESAGVLSTTPVAIRKISKRSFMVRIGRNARIAIRKSVNDIVIDIHEDLKATNSVDLDNLDVSNALSYLISLEEIPLSAQDLTLILADGTQGEI